MRFTYHPQHGPIAWRDAAQCNLYLVANANAYELFGTITKPTNRIVQITFDDGTLYALDTVGQVWIHKTQGWKLLGPHQCIEDNYENPIR